MARYELLLISRIFQEPRQFELMTSGRISGVQLGALLRNHFPEQQWYSGSRKLEEISVLSSGERLILGDLPQPAAASRSSAAGLKLYVLDGPDAGAWIPLSQGEHLIGRTAPLWLEDPLVSRTHARLFVSPRSLRLVAEPAQQILLPDGACCDMLDLSDGSVFRLGTTCFAVGDPLMLQAAQAITSEQLEVTMPKKPELARFVALMLAAFVPILSGVLLATITGSMLFLILSGVSALMGLVPASQLFSERRRWKRLMREQRARAIQARTDYAAPLGSALLAGLEAAALQLAPGQLPPLVWGKGLWTPQDAQASVARGWHRLLRGLRRSKPDEPWFGPVFCPPLPESWQIVAEQNTAAGEVLAGLLARFLPAFQAGVLSLVVDPSIRCLPASLLLLPSVRVARLIPDTGERIMPSASRGLDTLYLTAHAPEALPGTLVISVRPEQNDAADYWIDPVAMAAKLPDNRLELQQINRMHFSRFDRLVQQFVALKPSCRQACALEPEPETGTMQASVGLSDTQEEVMLDLDLDGPHMLICGTTGSGKSEALRRIIAEFARHYAPRELALALIDFKGGAGLGIYEDLPHVQLFASDLDEAAAQRTLEQLEHEVRRREELLAAQRCSDIGEYHALEAPVPDLPRLLVVVDEFRVFIESLPQAGSRIDRLAAVGRALGIHLMLSTQRPAGALTGQTRANLNTVIALHVNDPSESVELIGTTAATQLNGPGQAIMHSASRTTRKLQFHLAIEPSLQGELSERNRKDLSLVPMGSFKDPGTRTAAESIRTHVQQLASLWESAPKPESGFAPALPTPSAALGPPASWPGIQDGAICCGVSDNLRKGRLDPLVLDPARTSSLLVCGLPEAGARQLFGSLASLPRKVLCIGPSPVLTPGKNLRVVTGEDPYEFFDALDFLESDPKDTSLIVLVHSLSQLQSNLHPQHFQRLDEALGLLLRGGGADAPLIVCAVDRDQNALRSTGLFTEQWYFPLNATESLKMIWPKIPACSPLPGRGVRVCAEQAPQVFQLTELQAAECGNGAWPQSPELPAGQAEAAGTRRDLLGFSPFTGFPEVRPAGSRMIALCPDAAQRAQVASVLAQRWGACLISGVDELEQTARDMLAGKPTVGPALLCVCLPSTNDPRLAAVLESLWSAGVATAIFAPPSSRLAYELGLPAAGVDDRQMVLIEVEHPQDMQPLGWPPMQRRSNVAGQGYWRAIIARDGQPRMIHIPRPLSGGELPAGPIT